MSNLPPPPQVPQRQPPSAPSQPLPPIPPSKNLPPIPPQQQSQHPLQSFSQPIPQQQQSSQASANSSISSFASAASSTSPAVGEHPISLKGELKSKKSVCQVNFFSDSFLAFSFFDEFLLSNEVAQAGVRS